MDWSDVQETLMSLYLRLNGYVVSGFIVHAQNGATTEMNYQGAIRRLRRAEEQAGREGLKHRSVRCFRP